MIYLKIKFLGIFFCYLQNLNYLQIFRLTNAMISFITKLKFTMLTKKTIKESN